MLILLQVNHCRHPAAAFKYVRDVLADPAAPLSAQQRDAFTAAVLAQAPQLLSLDAPAAAQVRGQAGLARPWAVHLGRLGIGITIHICSGSSSGHLGTEAGWVGCACRQTGQLDCLYLRSVICSACKLSAKLPFPP